MFNAHEFLVFSKVAKMFGATVDTDVQHRRVTVGMEYDDTPPEGGRKIVKLRVVFDANHGAVIFYTRTDDVWHSVPQERTDRSTEWYAHLRLRCSGGVQLR